jgi:hypothetical protein
MWSFNNNDKISPQGTVWVVEIGLRYDRGVYGIYDDLEKATEVFDFCLAEWHTLCPTLSKWNLNTRRFDRQGKVIKRYKVEDGHVVRGEWENG